MQQGLLDKHDSLDLLKDLDINILSVGLEGAEDIFGEMDLHDLEISDFGRGESAGSLIDLPGRKGSINPLPLHEAEIATALSTNPPASDSTSTNNAGAKGPSDKTASFTLDDVPFNVVAFDQPFHPILNLDTKASNPVAKSVGPMPIKGEEASMKDQDSHPSVEEVEADILSGQLDSMGFNLQFQFPFNDDLALDVGSALKTELHDIETLSEPSVKPRNQISPRTALANTSASIAIPKLPPQGQGDKRFVGAYSPTSRARRIERFMEKRKHRVWTKTVKYDVRKNFADTRMRVKGRFVKKDDEALLREIMALA